MATAPTRVMVFTWNVGHAAPSYRELDEWLPPNGDGIDLLIVATQENAYIANEGIHFNSHGSLKTVSHGAGANQLKQTTIDEDDDDDKAETQRISEVDSSASREPMPATEPSWLRRTRQNSEASHGSLAGQRSGRC